MSAPHCTGMSAHQPEPLTDVDVEVHTDLRADITSIEAQYGPIPEGLVEGVPTSFANAWTAKFAPLADWVREHRALPEQTTAEELLEVLGTTTDAFGRFRSISLIDTRALSQDDRDDDYRRLICEHGDGCYVEVHTRLGGGNRECWCSDDSEHHCYVETIETIQAMPGYVDDYDQSWDCTYADFYFRVDGLERLAHRDAMANLAVARSLVLSGQTAPWDVFDIHHAGPTRSDIYRARQDARDVELSLARLNSRRADRVAALAAPMPDPAPVPRQRQRTGRNGRKLKGTEPVIPTCTFAQAQARVDKLQAKVDEFDTRKAQLDAFMNDSTYALIHDLVADSLKITLSFAEADHRCLADAITDRDILIARAHREGTQAIDAEIHQLEQRIERCAAICDHTAHAWVQRWPGTVETCPPRPTRED